MGQHENIQALVQELRDMTVRLSKELRSTKQELAQREKRLRNQIDTLDILSAGADIENGLDRSLIRFQVSIITVLEILLIKSFAPRTNKSSNLIFLLSTASAGFFVKAAYDSHSLCKGKKENRELAAEQLRREID